MAPPAAAKKKASLDDLKAVNRLIGDLPIEAKERLVSHPAMKEKLAQGFWPQKGPQQMAWDCEADELLYGGQAGGGKSGLIIGLALRKHFRSLILRRHYTDSSAMQEDLRDHHELIDGHRDGWNGSAPAKQRTDDGRLVEFGGCKNIGDEMAWKGQPHDLLAIDEASQFAEVQVRNLMGWVRSVRQGQKCRVVLATNPPENADEGQWLFEMFGPWLDPGHPLFEFDESGKPLYDGMYGCEPGKLMWYVVDEEGDDMWVDGPDPVQIGDRVVEPKSRTFIPAKLEDNIYLAGDGEYQRNLDNLQEPLRSAVRDGNWMIVQKDAEWQLIPTAWVMAAQERWTEDGYTSHEMTACSVDPAGRGKDPAGFIARHHTWFSQVVELEGPEKETGHATLGMVMKNRRHNAPIIVDVGGGYAGALIERLQDNELEFQRYDGGGQSIGRTQFTNEGFANRRSEDLYRIKEALDPEQEGGAQIMLPPDRKMMAELCSWRWGKRGVNIYVEPKENVRERLGRSPTRSDRVMMAMAPGERAKERVEGKGRRGRQIKNVVGYSKAKKIGRR